MATVSNLSLDELSKMLNYYTREQVDLKIQTGQQELVCDGGNADTVDNMHLSVLTQAEYDDLIIKDENTLYIILDAEEESGSGSTVDLSNYYKKTETYSKLEIDTKLSNLILESSNISIRDVEADEVFSVYESVSYGNIIVTPSTVSVNEGSTVTFAVKLDKAPSSDQIVTITKTNLDITLSRTSLTFTPSNYAIMQSIRVTAAEDNDYVDDTDIITLSSPNVSDQTITVTIIDNDIEPENPIAVEGVALNRETTRLGINSMFNLTAALTPYNATNKNVRWSINNTNVTIISNDLQATITGIAIGESVITVTTEDGNYTATCTITVEETYPPAVYKDETSGFININTSKLSDNTSWFAERGTNNTAYKYYTVNILNTLGYASDLTAEAATNVFNGVIPFIGNMTLNSFVSTSYDGPDYGYIYNNGAFYARIPNIGVTIFEYLKKLTDYLPVIYNKEKVKEYIISDEIIDNIDHFITASTGEDYCYVGYMHMTTPPIETTTGEATNAILNGINSLGGVVRTSNPTTENYYVNVTGERLNYYIEKSKIGDNTLIELKNYLRKNRLIFWVFQ